MKLKHLQSMLEDLDVFESPKIELEQYPTTAHLASQMIYTAYGNGDIEDKVVVDLGCGCGVLSVASILLGAGHVVGVDIDDSALAIAQSNVEAFEDMYLDLIQCNVENVSGLKLSADTVILNPPFGTRKKGADMEFLTAAINIATTAVYSLHKSSTRAHIIKTVEQMVGPGRVQVVAEMRYNIEASYKFHKQKSKDIAVDLIHIRLGDD